MHGRKRNWKPRLRFANTEGLLYRHIDIKLIIGADVKTKRHRAAPGKGYTLENIREACDTMIEALEKGFPGVEFREVQVAPNAFNYIAVEQKEEKDGHQIEGDSGTQTGLHSVGEAEGQSPRPIAESERPQRSDP